MQFISRVTQLFKLMAMQGVLTFVKASSNAIQEGATDKDVIKSTLNPTVGAVLGATVNEITSNLNAI